MRTFAETSKTKSEIELVLERRGHEIREWAERKVKQEFLLVGTCVYCGRSAVIFLGDVFPDPQVAGEALQVNCGARETGTLDAAFAEGAD